MTPYDPATLLALSESEEYPADNLADVRDTFGEPARPSAVCIAYPELGLAFSTVRLR
jgi:hypothetical protein